MKKKLLAIVTVFLFILTSFTVTTTLGMVSDKSFWNDGYLNTTLLRSNENAEYWALLVAPHFGDSDFVSKARYFRDVLISGGWSEDHIITLLYENATKENFINAIDQIVKNDSHLDTTLISIHSHGGMGRFSLMDYGMDYEELDRELDNLDSAAVGIVINSCYSGSAIPHLQQDGRVIVTSSRDNEKAGYFSHGFITGLIGFADKKTGIGDNNEMVSMEEEFNYCMDEYDWPTYHPQIQDNYTGQLNLINLDMGNDKMDQFPNFTMRWDESQIIGGNEHGFKYQSAQSFKPSFDILTKVRLCITAYFKWTEPDIVYPLSVSIRKNLTGEDLTSVSIPPSNVIEYDGYYIFDFPDIQVTPYDTYYIVVNISSEATDLQYTWKGREDECYSNGKSYYSSDCGKTWQDPSSGVADLFFVTYGYVGVIDNNPPNVEIIKPEKALYIINFKIRSYLICKPFIIGKIDITVDATDDESGMDHVEFYIDDKLKSIDISEPFSWTWKRGSFIRHRHIIKTIAYDNAGNSASDEITVWKFF